MPNEKQTSGWEQRYKTLTKHSQFIDHSRIMGFIAQERLEVAKAMAEAVVATCPPRMCEGYQAEVSRLTEEFIAKL